MLFIKCVDLPLYNYRWFSKNCFAFFGYWQVLTLFPDAWLYSYFLYVDSLDLKLNIFPQGIPGLFWKLTIFKIHIWWHDMVYSFSYIYTWMVKNAKFVLILKYFCYQGCLNWAEAWFQCDLTNVANFCCFKATEGAKLSQLVYWQTYLLFTWLLSVWKSFCFSVIFSF